MVDDAHASCLTWLELEEGRGHMQIASHFLPYSRKSFLAARGKTDTCPIPRPGYFRMVFSSSILSLKQKYLSISSISTA